MTVPDNKILIDLSNFFEYSIFSNGYSWMEYEHEILIQDKIDTLGIEEALNDPVIWNMIGSDIFNMPYMEISGSYSFIFPELSDLIEADVKRKENIGKIISILMSNPEDYIFFNNSSKFILYNNKIEVENLSDINNANIINIVFNVISMYLLQQFKRGLI